MDPKRSDTQGQAIDDLPKVEMEILSLLLHRGSATTRDVVEGLAPRTMSLPAAQAQLLRLERKGLVTRRKVEGSNSYQYVPTKKVQPTYRRIMRRMVDRLFAGNPVVLMESLLDSRPPTAEQIRQMEELIEQAKRQGRQRQ